MINKYRYYFVVPSFRRPDRQFTLKYLNNLGYPKDQILLFLQDEQDVMDYKKEGAEEISTIIYFPAKNIGEKRQKILEYMPKGSYLIFLDDDLSSFMYLKDSKLIDITDKSKVDKMIKIGFRTAKKYRTNLWGMYLIKNAFFMDNTISFQSLIIGRFMGIINNNIRFAKWVSKEDFEISCYSIRKFGKSVRFNNLVVNYNNSQKGGCHTEKYKEQFPKYTELILKKYPDLVKPNSKRKNEIKMAIRSEKIQFNISEYLE